MQMGGVELEVHGPGQVFGMDQADDLPVCLPHTDRPEVDAVDELVVVHVLPARLEPVEVRTLGLVRADEEVADPGVVGARVVVSHAFSW
jgi:hypothetical protein